MTEGFFGPLFFVWLGASLDLRSFAAHPAMILLGVALGFAAVVVHMPRESPDCRGFRLSRLPDSWVCRSRP